jgi:hypothetical protein
MKTSEKLYLNNRRSQKKCNTGGVTGEDFSHLDTCK